MASIVRDGKSHRCRDTVAPLAEKLGLEVWMPCDKQDPDCFAKQVTTLMHDKASIVAAWQHNDMGALVEALEVPGYEAYEDWPKKCPSADWSEPSYLTGSKCYDLIYHITFARQSSGVWQAVSIAEMHEGFGGFATSPCAQDLSPSTTFVV